MIELRRYQKEAAQKIEALLREHYFAYLSGEVRTGKTFTVLSVIKKLKLEKVLFVTKKKAIASIEKDRDAIELTNQVTVINYEQIHKWDIFKWDCVVVDEAHSLGAYPKPSQRWRRLHLLEFRHLILMSGTPSPESYSQLFHQGRLSARLTGLWGRYRNFYEWAKDYVDIFQKKVGTGQLVNDYSDAREEMVLEAMEPYMVRMTQEEAGFKTTINEEVRWVEMSPLTYDSCRAIIDDGITEFYTNIDDLDPAHVVLADTGAKRMSKLRQLYSGTCITEDGEGLIIDDSKARFIREEYEDYRIAIMYVFQAEGRMLRETFSKRATDSPEVFNSDPNSVFIGQVQSSREGVNLSSADYLLFLGVDYSALSYIQARDRASFLGRTKANNVHFILATRSIEPRVLETVRRKESYTTSHFRKDRIKLSTEANQGILEGLARYQVNSNQ